MSQSLAFIAKWKHGRQIKKRKILKWLAELAISKKFGLRLSQIQTEQSQIEWLIEEKWPSCKKSKRRWKNK